MAVSLYVITVEIDNYFNGSLHDTSITYTGNPNECWYEVNGNLVPCKIDGGPTEIGIILLVFGQWIVLGAVIIVVFIIWRKRK